MGAIKLLFLSLRKAKNLYSVYGIFYFFKRIFLQGIEVIQNIQLLVVCMYVYVMV